MGHRQIHSPPILIAEGLDFLTFATIEDAESHLEGIDVAEGRINIFDGRGRPLQAVAVDPQTVRIGRVPVGHGAEAALRARILRFAELTGLRAPTGGLSSAAVPDLIQMVYRYQHPNRRLG